MLLDLTGKKILVTGIANNRSIAWGIAQQLKAAGAELGITYCLTTRDALRPRCANSPLPWSPAFSCL